MFMLLKCIPGLLVGVPKGHDLGQRVVGHVEVAEVGLDAEEYLRRPTPMSLMERDDALRF